MPKKLSISDMYWLKLYSPITYCGISSQYIGAMIGAKTMPAATAAISRIIPRWFFIDRTEKGDKGGAPGRT